MKHESANIKNGSASHSRMNGDGRMAAAGEHFQTGLFADDRLMAGLVIQLTERGKIGAVIFYIRPANHKRPARLDPPRA